MNYSFKDRALFNHLTSCNIAVVDFIRTFNKNKEVHVLYFKSNIDQLPFYFEYECKSEEVDYDDVKAKLNETIYNFSSLGWAFNSDTVLIYNQLKAKTYFDQGMHFYIPVSKTYFTSKELTEKYPKFFDFLQNIDSLDLSELLVYLEEEENCIDL